MTHRACNVHLGLRRRERGRARERIAQWSHGRRMLAAVSGRAVAALCQLVHSGAHGGRDSAPYKLLDGLGQTESLERLKRIFRIGSW